MLNKPKTGFFTPLKKLFSRSSPEIKDLIPELEELLLSSDVGLETTDWLINALTSERSLKTSEQAYPFLQTQIKQLLTPQTPFVYGSERPLIYFFVGINGGGKTTSIGKFASQLTQQGMKTLLIAADTFRAAAQEQLTLWGQRCGAPVITGPENADPASVVFEGIEKAIADKIDVVLVDTAGRLHTKSPLMDELSKMVRVAEKAAGRKPDEVFLILDATTGQNGLIQAQTFLEKIPLTGLILSKFDATAKGGIILSVVKQTGLPLRFVGIGEGVDDFKPFDAAEFSAALLVS